LLKEWGSYNLVQNRGHRRPVLRPRCMGLGEVPYPTFHSILFFFSVIVAWNYKGFIAFDIKRPVFMRLYAGATMYAALVICYAVNIEGMCDDIQSNPFKMTPHL